MSNKTNEEKLRILNDRLNHIKKKQEIASSTKEKKEKNIDNSSIKIEQPYTKRRLISFSLLKYVAIIICTYLVFYAYNNINSSTLEDNKTSMDEVNEINKNSSSLEYNFKLQGDKIVILSTFEDEMSAKAMTNDLIVKGFKADYFFLPNKSNSTEEIYKVFIGPYEHEEETNQWVKNLNLDFEIISL